MIGQIIEVARPNRYLSLEYGSMIVSSGGQELGRVAFDDILALIINPRGVALSASVIAELADRGIPCVIAGKNYLPSAYVLPVSSNFESASRIGLQISQSLPTKKRAWQQLVKAKILMQALALEAVEKPAKYLWAAIGKVKSGDPQNYEAQAARYYWRTMFGESFRRQREAPGANALLNYGYAVMRAGVARAISAAGLHPAIGIHHRGPTNTMRLADDFIEPYRPLVDLRVWAIVHQTADAEVSTVNKKLLVHLLTTDVPSAVGVSPVTVTMHRLAQSYVRYLKNEDDQLETPSKEWASYLVGITDV